MFLYISNKHYNESIKTKEDFMSGNVNFNGGANNAGQVRKLDTKQLLKQAAVGGMQGTMNSIFSAKPAYPNDNAVKYDWNGGLAAYSGTVEYTGEANYSGTVSEPKEGDVPYSGAVQYEGDVEYTGEVPYSSGTAEGTVQDNDKKE